MTCYVDYAVQEYILGSGATQFTVAYDRHGEARSYDLYSRAHAAGEFGPTTSAPLKARSEYEANLDRMVESAESWLSDVLEGRESLVFLAPVGAHDAIAVEVWQAIEQWDVQREPDGTVNAVRFGVPENHPEHTQTLANLKSRITTAASSDAFAGSRIANVSGVTQYYRDIGAYGVKGGGLTRSEQLRRVGASTPPRAAGAKGARGRGRRSGAPREAPSPTRSRPLCCGCGRSSGSPSSPRPA